MRVLMLGNCQAPILQRLVAALRLNGVEVFWASHDAAGEEGVLDLGPLRGYSGFVRCVPTVRALVKKYEPDIIHAHGATHYGLTAALCPGIPYVLALWGSDIMLTPNAGSVAKRKIFRSIIRLTVRRARLCHSSSSHVCQRAGEISGQSRDRFQSWFWGVMPETLWSDPPDPVVHEMENEFPIAKQIVLCGRGLKSVYRPDLIASIIKETTRRGYAGSCNFVVLRGYSSDAEVSRFLDSLKGFEDSFVFINRLLNEEELALLYTRSRVHLSLPFTDSLGGGVIEPAMAGSYPVLSEIPGNNWFVRHYHGKTFPFEEKNTDSIEKASALIQGIVSGEFEPCQDVARVRADFGAKKIVENFHGLYKSGIQ